VDRHRALFHDHLVAIDGAGNLRNYRLDVREIGCARIALRRAHGDKNSLAALDGRAQIRRKSNAAPCRASISGKWRSKIGTPPSRSIFALASLLSTQTIWWPISAKQTAATSPTYLDPITQMETGFNILLHFLPRGLP